MPRLHKYFGSANADEDDGVYSEEEDPLVELISPPPSTLMDAFCCAKEGQEK
jgi:hypothetical protein